MKPIIILIEPQMGENIGAAARAMANCGLSDMRIVNPRDGWPNERADAMSSGAFAKMNPVTIYQTTAQAIADCHYVYATTARPRDMVKPVLDAKEAAHDVIRRINDGQRCAFLFGPERTGLTNEDIALSHAILTIPTNPDFPSLNLGQGVLLCAYEWYQLHHRNAPIAAPAQPKPLPAPHEELNALFDRLENALKDGHFFKTQEMRPTVMRNLKNTLARAELTSQEINTLHGVITALGAKKTQ